MLRRGIYRLSVFLSGLLLQGCIPFPHRATISPSVVGYVKDQAGPVAGLQVTYRQRARGSECSSWDQVSVTDQNGRFIFAAGREFFWFVFLGDPIYAYEICGQRGEEKLLLLQKSDFGILQNPVELSCDLDRPLAETGGRTGRCDDRLPKGE